jgi:lantibiotic modifying enzyme
VQDETLLETRSGRPKKGLSWKPILSESLTHIANDAINATSVELLKRERGSISPFEMCDIAVMCGYLEVVEPSAGWENIAVEYLNCAATRISANRTRWPALFDGIAACGWAFEHISQAPGDAMEEWQDISDPIEEIDSFLLKMLQERSWKWGYDLISGLVGLGVYFLERLPRASAIDGIQLILNHLFDLSEKSWGGTTWHTPPEFLSDDQRKTCPAGYYNLGVAHGVPGVVGFLASTLAAGIEVEKCRDLLEGTVRWLVARQGPPNSLTRYDSWFVPGREPQNTRLGWCYGDLGLGAVLYLAGLQCGHEDWCNFGRIATDNCLKRTTKDGWVNDQGLCHGSFGVAHIMNRMYQATEDERYADSANIWFEHGLRSRKSGVGVAGFYAYRPDLTPTLRADVSLLSGASGMVLAMLSAIYPVEPAWDRLLLLSGYAPRGD